MGGGGVTRPIPELGALPQDSTPTTYYHTRQIRITFIMLIYANVKSWTKLLYVCQKKKYFYFLILEYNLK